VFLNLLCTLGRAVNIMRNAALHFKEPRRTGVSPIPLPGLRLAGDSRRGADKASLIVGDDHVFVRFRRPHDMSEATPLRGPWSSFGIPSSALTN
jgi:hypothetical protein